MVPGRWNAVSRAAALFCLVAGTAQAAENLGWHGGKGEHGASLFYGIPQSGHAPLSFSCAPGSDALAFVFPFEPAGAAEGVEVEVLLQAGDIEVPIATTGTRLEMDDLFILEGRTVLDARLADLITSRGTLIVFVEDGAEEFPLDGAREAAAALIETCAGGDEEAGLPGVETCAVSAWSTDSDPDGLNVRAAPDSKATIIGSLPAPRETHGERFATEVSITGSSDGWLRISEGLVIDYIGDDPTDTAFEGVGWVSGRHLGLGLNYRYLHSGPSLDTPIVARLVGKDAEGVVYGPDSFRVDRIHACRGDWVEVEGAPEIDGVPAGARLRGWTTGTCSNQVTTCP